MHANVAHKEAALLEQTCARVFLPRRAYQRIRKIYCEHLAETERAHEELREIGFDVKSLEKAVTRPKPDSNS